MLSIKAGKKQTALEMLDAIGIAQYGVHVDLLLLGLLQKLGLLRIALNDVEEDAATHTGTSPGLDSLNTYRTNNEISHI